jgi:hypothetical protein
MTTHKSGIALDIDDTLSQTLLYWIQGLQEKLGGLEDMSPAEIMKEIKHTRDVPEWNTPEAMEYITELCNEDSLQEVIPVVEGAIDGVQRINAIVPIVAYVTARPNTVINGTTKWLKRHGFPDAPLMTRPSSVSIPDGMKWKAEKLIASYPHIQGIIDNDAKLAEYLPSEYQGHFFLLSEASVLQKSSINLYVCPDWESVVQQVEKVFSAPAK